MLTTPALAFLLDLVDASGLPYDAFWALEYDALFKGNMFEYFAEKDAGEFKDADLVEDFYQMTTDLETYSREYYGRNYDEGARILKNEYDASNPSPATQAHHAHKHARKEKTNVLTPETRFAHEVTDLVGYGAQCGWDLRSAARNKSLWKGHEHVIRLSRKFLGFLTNLNELGLFQQGEFLVPTACHFTSSHRCVKFRDKGSLWRFHPDIDVTVWPSLEVGKWYHPLKVNHLVESASTVETARFLNSLQ
jgi:hypothetical protein